MTQRDYPLIDTHAHIFRADLPMAPGGLHLPTEHFEAEDYLSVLDANGVRFAAIAAPSFLGTYNDYMLVHLRRHRDRLRGTAILEPDTDPYILKAMADDGVVGVRLSLRGSRQLPDLGGYEYQRFFRRLADLDWHAHLHIEGQRLPDVLPLIAKSPVRLLVDHFGRPDPAQGVASPGFEALLGMVGAGKAWVKLSGGFRIATDPAPLAARLMEVGGPDQLVWGSDCPFTDFADKVSYADVVARYEEWVPNHADRVRIAEVSRVLYHLQDA